MFIEVEMIDYFVWSGDVERSTMLIIGFNVCEYWICFQAV